MSISGSTILMFIVIGFFSSNYRTCSGRALGRKWTLSEDDDAPTSLNKNTNGSFNVLDYGAKGDGNSDETKAFLAAWEDVCQMDESIMLVPSGYVFLVQPISFVVPNCGSNIIFQLDGTIIAPTSSSAWGSGFLQWIEFKNLKGITIRGKGTIDGQGSVWWTNSRNENGASSENLPNTKPTALRFYGSTDITVTGIKIQNSPQTHLKFDSCTKVKVSDITVSSPSNSPNTDGIHLQNTQNVLIQTSTLACGDDCISIQTGCSNVYIHDITCGPGHGISIGSLGKGDTKACVSNITVKDSKMQQTLTGVRIKTWQGGSGLVSGIMFANIQVSGVKTPIVIDQYYCEGDESKCKNSTSAVTVEGITYQNIRGTYTEATPIRFACSDNLPCQGITLNTIELEALDTSKLSEPFCWQAYGQLQTSITPPIDCFKTGKILPQNPTIQC
ncbi:polygalacturonase At1g48100-like [Impatiens glandulifera]|uniref:polygalacturonase At1g48100-like n=1 Tax=Impatiens glandulifera TaxID=253017 RepID=UPI001FB186F8|nr:polygalacturonase At1g48100-like [Impatiens glandulifera]